MKKSTLIALIVATALSVFGFVLALTVFAVNHFDVQMFEREALIEKPYTVEEAFSSIDIDTDTASVTLLPATDGVCRVVCVEEADYPYDIEVRNGTLFIEGTADFYDFTHLFAIHFRTPSITLYLPEDTYESLKVTVTTGDVRVDSAFTFENAHIKSTTSDAFFEADVRDSLSIGVTTGDVTLSHMTCKTASITVTTGDVELTHVTASGKLTVKTTTGDVELERSDAAELDISTTTGDVEGSLLSGKSFDCRTTTGDISYPNNSTGGKCRIRATTGDIDITVIGK